MLAAEPKQGNLPELRGGNWLAAWCGISEHVRG
jgi:hypothetical protein